MLVLLLLMLLVNPILMVMMILMVMVLADQIVKMVCILIDHTLRYTIITTIHFASVPVKLVLLLVLVLGTQCCRRRYLSR